MQPDFEKGMYIAANYDVSTMQDRAVLYSISYQKNKENRDKAYAYVKAHKGYQTLDDTICGKTLCEKGYQNTSDIPADKLKQIWKVASERFIKEASGNLTAFVDHADKRSTFCTVEVPAILQNDKIKTINKTDKFIFIENNKRNQLGA